MRVIAKVADDVHSDPLVELPLQLFRQREILDDERIEAEAEIREDRGQLIGERARQRVEIRRHVEKRNLALCEGVRYSSDNRIPKVAIEIDRRVHIARPAHLLVKEQWVREMVRVQTEAAQTDHPKILVTNRDRIWCSPLLVRLQARREEIDVGFERRLKCLVPVAQAGENRKRARFERVEPWLERVGRLALIDE